MVILRVLSYSLVGYIYVTVFGGFHILHEDVSVKPSLCDHLLGPQPETGFVYNYRVVCMVPHTIPYTVYQVHGVVSHSQVYMVPYTIATSMDHTSTYTSRKKGGENTLKKLTSRRRQNWTTQSLYVRTRYASNYTSARMPGVRFFPVSRSDHTITNYGGP